MHDDCWIAWLRTFWGLLRHDLNVREISTARRSSSRFGGSSNGMPWRHCATRSVRPPGPAWQRHVSLLCPNVDVYKTTATTDAKNLRMGGLQESRISREESSLKARLAPIATTCPKDRCCLDIVDVCGRHDPVGPNEGRRRAGSIFHFT